MEFSLWQWTAINALNLPRLLTAAIIILTGADLGFYKGGCPIHLKGAPPNYFDPCYRNQTIFWP